MRPGPVVKAAAGGLNRRRTQTLVIFTALLVTTAAVTLSLALLAVSNGPFQHAFDAAHGAHVVATVDAGKTDESRIAAGAKAPGVTEFSGPFPIAAISFTLPPPAPGASAPTASAKVVGRGTPDGPLDRITLEAGRWAQGPHEIVLSGTVGFPQEIGTTLTVTSGPDQPQLTIVGIADSITNSADAWAAPDTVTALRSAGTPAQAQVLYRFADAATADAVHADVAALGQALGAGVLGGTSSWLTAQSAAQSSSTLFAPFVVAFAVMGLAMSVLIVGNVVSGAVLSSYKRIGVLKSLGFSPAQVVGSYLAWVMVPAIPGCVGGVALGSVLAVGVLNQSSHVYGVTSQSAPAWVPVAAPLAMLTLAAVAALLPALRAGRLGAAEAIATGQAPRARYGKLAQSALGRLRRLPRPVTIGLAAPFARPLRTLVTLSAIAFGTIAVLFATGLNTSLVRVTDAQTATAIGQVNLLVPNPLDPGSAQDTTAATAIRAQPGTAHAVGESSPTVTVPGVAGQASAHALLGDASWVGMDLIAGRWFAGDGEIVVNTAFLTQSGHTIGDTVTVTTGGRQGTPRIVGEVFDPEGHQKATLYTSWNTLGGAAAGLRIDRYDIGLTPGTDRSSYATALTGAFPAPPPGGPGYFADAPTKGERGKTVAVALIGVLTLMMAFVAALGVLNTVLQSTRERVHDLGVFKAVGMTPRQTIVMVVCWVAGPAVIAAAVAVPVAVTLHRWVLDAMARTSGTGLPPDIRHVYSAGELALVALSGLVIAALGALLPASWAAGSRTATALRAE